MATKRKKLPQYLAAISISIGAIGCGTAIAWPSNIIDRLKTGKLNDIVMDDDALGWAGSCVALGAMVICIPMGFICQLVGRKTAALLAAIPLLLGWILVTVARHAGLVYAGRVLTGIGGGAFCVCGPLYTSEIAEAAIRGTLGSFFQFFLNIGILYVNILGYAMPSMLMYNLACAAIPVIFVAVFAFQPESPVYYMENSHPGRAARALERLGGRGDYDPARELRSIQSFINLNRKRMANFRESIQTKAAKKAMVICFMLMVYQQFCGDSAVTFYTEDIFMDSGSPIAAEWCVIIIGIVQLIAVCFASWAIERAGRKILLMVSCGLMTVGSSMIALFFTFKDRNLLGKDALKSVQFMPIVGVIIFCIGFSLGMGPIAWMASSEIFPPEVKSPCISAAATLNWFLAFVVSRLFFNFSSLIGEDVMFYAFAGVAFSGIFFTYFVVPETKGKTFEQIVTELEGRTFEEDEE